MKQSVVHQLLLVTICGALNFTALGATRLWDEDEAFFATAAAEMHRHHEWVVPTFNEELFSHKPPVMYWIMRAGFAVFGVNELGARFGSALFSVLTAIAVYHLGRILFSRRAGFWAGLGFGTCLMWGVVSRAATPDSELTFFITAALLIYVRDVFGTGLIRRALAPSRTAASATEAALTRWLPQRWTTCAGIYAVMGVAVLVKGPIGVLLPGCTIGLFVLLQIPAVDPGPGGRLKRFYARLRPMVGRPFFLTIWHMRPLTAIAMVLLIAGPWFALVGWRTEGAFLREFFGVHNFGRFLKPMENHRGPIFYYVPVMLVGFFPWSMFALPSASHAWRGMRGRDDGDKKFQFVGCWALVMVGFFSIASTKLPNYVLPAYPAVALLTAAWLDAWTTGRAKTWAGWPWLALGTLAAVGVVIAIALPVFGSATWNGRPLLELAAVNGVLAADLVRLGWLGGIPAVGGTLALWCLANHRRRALRIAAVTAVLFTGSVLIVGAGILNPHQTSAALTAAIRQQGGEPVSIGAFRHSPPSLIFYAGTRVTPLRTAEDAVRFLAGHGRQVVVTTDQGLAQVRGLPGASGRVIDERPRFPRIGSVLVLSDQSTAVAARDEAGAR